MPDDLDYLELDRLLLTPAEWTQDDVSLVQAMLRDQKDAVSSLHPKDNKRRKAMFGVVQRMEAALNEHHRLS